MKASTQTSDNVMNSALNSVINKIEKKDFDSTKGSCKKLTSQPNAYTCPLEKKWNMITYKKGKKSSL